ncbi:DNA polymerase Y family protein [Bermanella marisrubri]|uniref:UmuC domain-containing protein n=1 Tax=Bermanella marisrubri TaxID=207949 RepID=Q1N4J7_9GAMM|nr:DNA polymerase Y family protein [Bermanella marisrubri]EAT13431.1 hypothetical protein RED65_01685 [Oceanobacter sp. RED65] [Bermanella marisrubri]QIZ84180.1 DNA polymerase Y family protein [Bermanella marisrubri]
MSLWLYLHFPALLCDLLDVQDPDQAVIMVSEQHHKIVQLNSVALEKELKIGMGLATAASLCHDIQVLIYDEEKESKHLKRIARWLYSVTADIGLYPPNGIVLRVDSMLHLYSDLKHYWHAVQQQLAHCHAQVHSAMGVTPLAARLLARTQTQPRPQISMDTKKLKQIALSKSLSDADIHAKTRFKLSRLGLNTVADIAKIPRAELAKRFGHELAIYLQKLLGEIQDPIQFYIPNKQFQEYVELAYEISNSQYLIKPLQRLLLRLQYFLQQNNARCSEITLQLEHREEKATIEQIASAEPITLAEKWQSLCAIKFENLKLKHPVIGITLTANKQSTQQSARGDLFSKKQNAMSENELISHLKIKLGDDRVLGIRLNNDERPEREFEYTKVSSNADCMSQVKFEATISNKKHSLLRPSFMLPQPQPLQEAVALHSPVERIVTGWWDNQPIQRDYFIARNESGQWLWVFKTPDKQWFVHGWFS